MARNYTTEEWHRLVAELLDEEAVDFIINDLELYEINLGAMLRYDSGLYNDFLNYPTELMDVFSVEIAKRRKNKDKIQSTSSHTQKKKKKKSILQIFCKCSTNRKAYL